MCYYVEVRSRVAMERVLVIMEITLIALVVVVMTMMMPMVKNMVVVACRLL